MPIAVTHTPTATAVGAATTQDAQIAAFVAAFSGGDVTARLFDGATLLDVATYTPWSVNSLVTPRRATMGTTRQARTFTAASTAATRAVLRNAAGVDICEVTPDAPATVLNFGAITSGAATRITSAIFTAKATLPVVTAPTSINISGASSGTTNSQTTVTYTLPSVATVAVTVTPTAAANVSYTTPAVIAIGQTATTSQMTRTADGTHAVAATTIPSLTVTGGYSYTSSAAVVGSAGTVIRIGSQSLIEYLYAYRATLPEGEPAASARMLPPSGFNAYAGSIVWRGKYVPGIVAGGHGDSYDDGGYGQDLSTGAWSTIVPPTTLGTSSALVNQWGEYGTPPTGQDGVVGRPASLHSFMTQVTVGDDIVAVICGAVGFQAGGLG